MGYKMQGFSGFKESPVKQHGKSFNIKGSSGVPVGQDFEKYAKSVHEQKFDKFQTQKQKGKEFVKNLKKGGIKAVDKVSKKQTFTKKGVIDMVTGKKVTKFPKDKSIQKIAKKGRKLLKNIGK